MGILEKMRLDGKTAFVTGGARGIGKSVATAFAQAGANVVIADFDIVEAEKTATEIMTVEKVKAIAVKTDVTDPASVENLIAVIKQEFGKLDIAFCNAGICMNIPAEEMTLEQWSKVINVNLTGVFLTAQGAGKLMIEQGTGGSIINTASMSAHIVNVPQPQCAYNASKAGVIQLTKSLAIEWAKHNIRVNSLSPGYIGTELTLNSKDLQPLIKEWNTMAPMHRLGTPEELQSICVYLAGDTSNFTSGSDFIVDGAFTCF
ncbi:NAD(P)-dependent dehydrogenase (short-subunit alcohol dehydrogenase family) [Cricetibacter osteomyelitidis]|uniref:NAD(P)-dependent dehydrogenase (Short-subunit alcohol dehydrogenase family) n=1 Tax=Cricetibacter osteomyelitidis TaxID=1521931 RepID=A0A4R2T8B2_9PAST|nr:SDR family oxidoreductase [Cricetibacter osteomyelitidis]TCP97816.1 NAD(P)-dependent dehydrogenase (short-subunit alcohol dehydrogenase family) [Cricetibacter osteomyelitidis]